VNSGTVVLSAAGGGFQFDVADACSGLRSLIVMTALAGPFAYYAAGGFWRKSVLFGLSIPLAMLANALRIFSVGFVAEFIGMDLAMTLYHDLSGYIVFFLAIALLLGTERFLETDWRKKLCDFKKRFKKRSPALSPSR
jgi:exosortase/archaeosortase family protein